MALSSERLDGSVNLANSFCSSADSIAANCPTESSLLLFGTFQGSSCSHGSPVGASGRLDRARLDKVLEDAKTGAGLASSRWVGDVIMEIRTSP